MQRSAETWGQLVCRFCAAETGGAGLEYMVFVAGWSVAVSVAMHYAGALLTAKFDTILTVFKTQGAQLR